MSLLQFVLIIAAVVFILFGVDLYKRRKMNALHFIIFFFGGGLIILFALDTSLLNNFGKLFGIGRGADLLVYLSLILLFYFYIELLNKLTKDKTQLTKLISQSAIQLAYVSYKDPMRNWKNTEAKDQFVFALRVYNEAGAVGEVIDEIIAHGFRKIVIVNDGSSDMTSSVLESKQKQYPDILMIILTHTINRWGGAANQTVYNFVKAYGDELKISWFVSYDADGQMDINDMDVFMRHIHQADRLGLDLEGRKPDLYLWSRFLEGAKTENMPAFRRFILFISKLVTMIFYGADVSDPHSWYRVVALPALRKINLTADGMHYANELNEQIQKLGFHYVEVPVHIRYTEYSLNKEHRQKNSNSIKLAMEMIYRKLFFK